MRYDYDVNHAIMYVVQCGCVLLMPVLSHTHIIHVSCVRTCLCIADTYKETTKDAINIHREYQIVKMFRLGRATQ